MVPQQLKIYILHDLCVMIMISVFPRSKTAYFVIYKNRPISKLKEKHVIKGGKNMKFTEVELHVTSRAEILYFTWPICNACGFGTPEV